VTTPTTGTTGTTTGAVGTGNTTRTGAFTSPRTGVRNRRVSTETKASWKTTEFWLYVVVAVGILIASMTVGSDSSATAGKSGNNAGDYFRADKAWFFITLLTIGYLLSRGLAKSGARDFYDDSYDPYGGDSSH
jgi:hypothetical protein